MTNLDAMHSHMAYKGPKEGIYTRNFLKTCVIDVILILVLGLTTVTEKL